MRFSPGRIALAAAMALASLASTAQAVTFNLDWSGLSAGEFTATGTGFSRTLNGITVTATGYSVSVPSSGGAGSISGPLPAIDVAACTNLNPALCPGGRANGLRLSRAGLGIRSETSPALGFNGHRDSDGNYVSELVQFDFSIPVSIGAIVVDDVANAPRDIWYAASASLVDLTGDPADIASSLQIFNSPDDATDGIFSHEANLTGVTSLLVGAPFWQGPDAPARSNFYVAGLSDVSATETGGPVASPVPLPAGLPLLLGALLGVGVLGRRRRAAA